jgi:hypothetical protein
MNVDKRQKRLLILLAVVMAYAAFDFLTHQDEYLNYYLGRKAEATLAVQPTQQTGEQAVPIEKQAYLKNWGHNPFEDTKKVVYVPRRKPEKKKPTFQVDAISFNGDSSVALVNGTIVKTGDWISGYKVIQITQKQVVLSNGTDRITLNLENF